MRFAKIVFLVAGIYGLLVLTPLYFMEGTVGGLTPPGRYRPMILPSVLEKLVYAIAVLVLHLQGRIASSVLAVGSVDWIFALLFFVAYVNTKPTTSSA